MDTFVKLDAGALDRIAAMGETVQSLMAGRLQPIAQEILDEARNRAEAHIRYVSDYKPGLYLAGFGGGVKIEPNGDVVGWVGNKNPLSHLLEYGFTISDLMIEANGMAMKFEEAGVGELFRREVHRHETQVRAYPAILPAFEARKGEVIEAARDVARGL